MKINVSADPFQTRQINNVSLSLFIAFLMGGILAGVTLDQRVPDFVTASAAVAMFVTGLYLLFAIKIANQWEKVVVLRFGRLRGMRGPGLFWIVPLVDSVSSWIDHRVTVTPFSAEKTLTKDTVPVDVDAVLFWVVWDAEKAALEVKDYQSAISWSAQTALRDIIGKMMLADILV
ncbi:MAG: SPFH domain-containing protein, partial [Chloroflexota bacterium]